jgi:hypothetical protein
MDGGEDPAELVALSCLNQSLDELSPEVKKKEVKCLCDLIKGEITANEALEITKQIVDTDQPVQKIIALLSISPDPISCRHTQQFGLLSSARRKARNWSQYEDQRLLAGVLKYGLDNWSQVSVFIGNGRTRAQSSQRWSRGLDPRIWKGPWTSDEESELMRQVTMFGKKAWKLIATNLGNRSDVQCRYHYGRLEATGKVNTARCLKTSDQPVTDKAQTSLANSEEAQEKRSKNRFKQDIEMCETDPIFDDFSPNFPLSDSESFWSAQNWKSSPRSGQMAVVNVSEKKDTEVS